VFTGPWPARWLDPLHPLLPTGRALGFKKGPGRDSVGDGAHGGLDAGNLRDVCRQPGEGGRHVL